MTNKLFLLKNKEMNPAFHSLINQELIMNMIWGSEIQLVKCCTFLKI